MPAPKPRLLQDTAWARGCGARRRIQWAMASESPRTAVSRPVRASDTGDRLAQQKGRMEDNSTLYRR